MQHKELSVPIIESFFAAVVIAEKVRRALGFGHRRRLPDFDENPLFGITLCSVK
jgi:hypothetical protein